MMLPKKRTHNCNTLDASSWRFSKDTRNILTRTSRGQLVLFAKNTLSFLLLALGSQDNIPRVSLACLSPRRVLDSKWNFSLTPFRRPALANFSQLFLFLFSKWGWLAIAIFQPESHRTKSLQCSKHLTRQFCALFLTEPVLRVGLYTRGEGTETCWQMWHYLQVPAIPYPVSIFLSVLLVLKSSAFAVLSGVSFPLPKTRLLGPGSLLPSTFFLSLWNSSRPVGIFLQPTPSVWCTTLQLGKQTAG